MCMYCRLESPCHPESDLINADFPNVQSDILESKWKCCSLQSSAFPLSGSEACWQVSVSQWDIDPVAFGSSCDCSYSETKKLLLFCNVALPLSSFSLLPLSLSKLTHLFHSPPFCLSPSFRLNSSSIMRSFLHWHSVSTYHLYSAALIEQTSGYSSHCEWKLCGDRGK